MPVCGVEESRDVAYSARPNDTIDVREIFGPWTNRIDTYTRVK